MSELIIDIPPHVNFNDIVVERYEEFVRLCTYELNFDLLDVTNYPDFCGYINNEADGFIRLTGLICGIVGVADIAQQQTVYRSLHFAKFALERMKTASFTASYRKYFAEIEQSGNAADTMLADVISYFDSNDAVRGLLHAFSDELDVSGEGKDFDLVALTLGTTWLLADRAMYEVYIEKNSNSLGDT